VPAAVPAMGPAGVTGGTHDDKYGDRLRARGVLRAFTSIRRQASCGMPIGGEVEVRHGPAGGVSGLETCGSVWSCPCCSAKIAHGRSLDLQAGIERWVGEGNSVALLTLTIQHKYGDKLEDLWDAVSRAWRRFVSCRAYKSARARFGVLGYHRTTEVTLGSNGWHVHLHVLYFVRGVPGVDSSAAFGSQLVDLWRGSVAGIGYRADAVAQDWKLLAGTAEALAGVAGYVTKGVYVEKPRASSAGALAMEVSRSDLKVAQAGSRTPFQLLADLVSTVYATGEVMVSDSRLWREWERVSRGRRQQVWSRGLRDALELGTELTDEELAELERASGEPLARISRSEWVRVFWDGRRHAALVALATSDVPLESAQAAVHALLVSYGCRFSGAPDLDDGPALARDYWRKRRAGRPAA
jgi:Replication protein